MSKATAKEGDLLHPHKRVQLFCEDESRTHQAFKDECDIRNIMSKYKRTGIVTHMNRASELYGDFTNVPDYQEALNTVIAAQEAFDDLPAETRKYFGNDPAKFLDFVHNPDNRDEMIRMGMIDVPVNQIDINSPKTDPKGAADPTST